MNNSELKEIFTTVLLNNITDSQANSFKLLAFDILSGERDKLQDHVGEVYPYNIEVYAYRGKITDLTEGIKKHNRTDIDIEATAALMEEHSTNYVYLKSEIEIIGINKYSVEKAIIGRYFEGDTPRLVYAATIADMIAKGTDNSRLQAIIKSKIDIDVPEMIDVDKFLGQ